MKSESLFNVAKKIIPGGVNSPVRAFKSVGLNPRFIEKADGAYIFDVEGNKYIDYVCSWGPMILGHNKKEIYTAVVETAKNGLSFGAPTELEVKMAEKIIQLVPSIEMVRMVNSGTEAVMSAIRLARGYTGRNKIIKFEGCYHGHSDSMLVKAGSGVMTSGVPDSLGVPEGVANDTLTAVFNSIDSVEALFNRNQSEIAAVIVEPVPCNMGVVLPVHNFLESLRDLCTKNKAVLIFDEVITGFRLGLGGAQAFYNVQADLVTYGKIIGGGLPVGAYGGKREIMECVSPCGLVYQAGTLSGNPIAMAAGLAQLNYLEHESDTIYPYIDSLGSKLRDGLIEITHRLGLCAGVNHIGSLCCMFLGIGKVSNYEDAKKSDTELFKKYFKAMFEQGINIAPSQFEAQFISYAHTAEDINRTLELTEKTLKGIME